MSSSKGGGETKKFGRGRRKKSRKLIVPKWKLFRANEPILSVFMWGVNHSISELSHVPPPGLLLPDDFKAYSKIKVDNHSFNKENMPSHFKFKDYCPNVFRNLREKFGIDERDYLKSLTKYEPEEDSTCGRVHSKFYISHDHKFVVKTLCAEDVAEVHSILQHYYDHVVEKHGKTLLPQFLGLYRLTVEGVETYLMVMRNIFSRKYPIQKKFDLKGSTVQRQASDKEKLKDLPTLKDNDFIEVGCKLYLPEEAKEKLLSLLTSDTEFLAKMRLMDYSLLVGIHDLRQDVAPFERQSSNLGSSPPVGGGGDSSEPDVGSVASNEYAANQPTPPDSPVPLMGAFSNDNSESSLEDEFYAVPSRSDYHRKEIYYIGLVDILTYYGVKKRTASAAKTVKYGPEAEISTVKPQQYARRLVEFVNRTVADGSEQ